MNIIVDAIQSIMDAGASVFLPLFITILGIVFGIKPFASYPRLNIIREDFQYSA